MATPIGASALVAALKKEGLTVVEVGNWRTHNRNHAGPWGPVHGVMIHHTVTSGSARTVEICRTGYSTLPGPLCHGVITKDGRVHLVGHGRANHAGSGDDDVLRAVINETALPADNETNTDGNRHFYGFECENLGDGRDPWPAVQLEAIERAAAALCRYHGWSERSVIGHLEWQPGKVDPRGFSMDSMRSRIRERLDRTPGGVPNEEDDVPAIAKLHEANPNDVRLVSGRWTPLAFADAVLHTGPRRLVGPTYVQLSFHPDTPAGTEVTGRFYRTDPDGSDPSGYGDVTTVLAGDGAAVQFLHNIDVPSGQQLRFMVRATSPDGRQVTLTHRVVVGDYLA